VKPVSYPIVYYWTIKYVLALSMSIHWHCYCTVHVYIVIHFCDSVFGLFLSGSESLQVFYCLFIYVLPLEIQLSIREGWNPINWFNPATLLSLSQARTWIFNIICRCFLCVCVCVCVCVQSDKMRGICSFCRYWCNWWPSLFKLSFHNLVYH